MPPPVPGIAVTDENGDATTAAAATTSSSTPAAAAIARAVRPQAVRIQLRKRASSSVTVNQQDASTATTTGPPSGPKRASTTNLQLPQADVERDLEAGQRPQSSLYHEPEEGAPSSWGISRLVGRKRGASVSSAVGDRPTSRPGTSEGLGAAAAAASPPPPAAPTTQVFRLSKASGNPPAPASEAGTVEGEQADVDAEESGTRAKIRGRRRALSAAVASIFGGGDAADVNKSLPETPEQRLERERAEYDRQVVDLLDVIDPEVSTLSTLSDLQNSLFVPDLGRFVDRAAYLRITRPTEELHEDLDIGHHERLTGRSTSHTDALERAKTQPKSPKKATKAQAAKSKLLGGGGGSVGHSVQTHALQTIEQGKEMGEKTDTETSLPGDGEKDKDKDKKDKKHRRDSIADKPEAARGEYYILPEGLVDWESWTSEEKADLDEYVRYLMRSKKWRFRRGWRGFRQYVRTPLGAFVTIYASLLAFWGAAWFLFLIGWIGAGSRQAYFVEICDQILVALFCVVGIGLAPFRTVDTYHMIWIAKYHYKSLRLYRQSGEPPLPDENDLPDPTRRQQEDVIRKPVLTVEEQATLIYHQTKFAKSHTFYRPHETKTHRAFPIDLLITVVILLDFHSIFQIALGSSTWSISYHESYKKVLTSVILACSISSNISAGIVITVGNRRTRKREILEEMLRKSITAEAVRRRQRHKEEREREEREASEGHVRQGSFGDMLGGRKHSSEHHRHNSDHGKPSITARVANLVHNDSDTAKGRKSSDLSARLLSGNGSGPGTPTAAKSSSSPVEGPSRSSTTPTNTTSEANTPTTKKNPFASLLGKPKTKDAEKHEMVEAPASHAAAPSTASGSDTLPSEPEKAHSSTLGGLLKR